jgi:uncharacterized protein YecE (DUF72 family)
MKLFAGASGYSFKEWKGDFYPEDMKPDGMLKFYAARLPTVEINNTFYQMPKTAMLENWVACTPADFRFAIKASRRITHFARLKAEEAADSVQYLYRQLEALGDKRGPALFQLPPFLKKDLPRLEAFLALLPEGHRAAFEFRNDSWFDDEVYALLRKRGAAAGGNRAVGLRAPAARGILRRGAEEVGAAARRDRLARGVRLLHARAHRAGLRAGPDALRAGWAAQVGWAERSEAHRPAAQALRAIAHRGLPRGVQVPEGSTTGAPCGSLRGRSHAAPISAPIAVMTAPRMNASW